MAEVQGNSKFFSRVTSEPQVSIKCPKCGSTENFSNGNRYRKDGTKTQRYLCRKCGVVFSENVIRLPRALSNRQISADLVKNLASVTEKKTVTVDEKDINGKLFDYHFKLKLQGYKESTIRLSYSVLNTLKNRGADLTNPETVKEVIANQSKTETAFKGKIWSGNRKRNVINAYSSFLKFIGLTWKPPSYEITRKIPFIPSEQEIDDLIAGTPSKIPAFLQLLKETAMRSGEAIRIPWKDVDFERHIIMCNQPEKGSNPRIFSELSGKLLTMLNSLPRENDAVFGKTNLNSLKATYTRSRKRLAFKLGNPRLKEIHFHTLRHWKATMLYHSTKDLLYVADFLGHKDTENTRLYVQLDKSLFQNIPNENFIIKTVSSIEEAIKLGEVGFEPFMVINGVQLMRKRK